jgi:nucleoside-diphosphate-sugar epimerase
MKKVLITGGTGYIASNIYKKLKGTYDIETISRKDFSLLDTDKVNSFFSGKFYDVIIHTAIIGGSRLKEDPPSIVHDNVKMLYNILSNKASYNRLINLGSGAELDYPKTPYGMSKSLISNAIDSLNNHYNIRIFAIFNEDELETRFIKSNILKYLNKEDLVIHQNKLMDFFSFSDFIKVIKMYIEVEELYLNKTFDCSYSKKYSLLEIASLINNLDTYKAVIQIKEESLGNPYIGNCTTRYDLNYKGLEKSIEDMYEVLKSKFNTL